MDITSSLQPYWFLVGSVDAKLANYFVSHARLSFPEEYKFQQWTFCLLRDLELRP